MSLMEHNFLLSKTDLITIWFVQHLLWAEVYISKWLLINQLISNKQIPHFSLKQIIGNSTNTLDLLLDTVMLNGGKSKNWHEFSIGGEHSLFKEAKRSVCPPPLGGLAHLRRNKAGRLWPQLNRNRPCVMKRFWRSFNWLFNWSCPQSSCCSFLFIRTHLMK